MKQEYIIGDWVKFEGKLARIEEVNSLYYLLREYYENYDPEANDEDCYLYKEAKDIEPILLTPKILEKNKWCLWEHHEKEFFDDVSWDSYYNRALSCVSLRFYPEEKAFFPYLYRESISEKPIKYVHQFQHLLFGLEINSEIKVTETVSKEKAIEKIQYTAMQVASVYACSAIFDEKIKIIEGKQKELEKAIVNLHDALKELENKQ